MHEMQPDLRSAGANRSDRCRSPELDSQWATAALVKAALMHLTMRRTSAACTEFGARPGAVTYHLSSAIEPI